MAKAVAKKAPTKTEIFNAIAEETGLNKKDVAAVFESLSGQISRALSAGKKTDEKSFTLPGLCKIVTKYKPAVKGGEERENPFNPGEMIITKPKPASQQVKIRPLKALKDMVN
ncbi:MAG: HU family DNA-binding protein [Planctomycetales bacterium]|nr:HU family DNA-binding protein [Planctomycetales bacterium]